MKLSKRILYTIGLGACAVMLYSMADTANAKEEYDEDLYGPEKLVVWYKPVPRVTFEHKVHTQGAGFECDSCHDDLFEMEHGAAQEVGDFNMKSIEEGKYCGACHDGDTAFGVTEDHKCHLCHTPPGLIVFTKPVKSVVFDHKIHVDEMDYSCSDCHSEVFEMHIGHAEQSPEKFTMEALYAGKYCGACHDGDQAFASNTKCTTCHIGVLGFDRRFNVDPAGQKKTGH